MRINNVNFYNLNSYRYQKPTVAFGKVIEPKILYDKYNYPSKIIFPKSIGLKYVCDYLIQPKILEEIRSECLNETNLEGLKVSKFAETQIKELTGMGASALAFLMENGNVLKITSGKHLKRKLESFDIPVYEEGKLFPTKPGYVYYYIEQYANPELASEKEILELVSRIRAMGYKLQDVFYSCNGENVREDQFGKTIDGKVYLLDPECAYMEK